MNKPQSRTSGWGLAAPTLPSSPSCPTLLLPLIILHGRATFSVIRARSSTVRGRGFLSVLDGLDPLSSTPGLHLGSSASPDWHLPGPRGDRPPGPRRLWSPDEHSAEYMLKAVGGAMWGEQPPPEPQSTLSPRGRLPHPPQAPTCQRPVSQEAVSSPPSVGAGSRSRPSVERAAVFCLSSCEPLCPKGSSSKPLASRPEAPDRLCPWERHRLLPARLPRSAAIVIVCLSPLPSWVPAAPGMENSARSRLREGTGQKQFAALCVTEGREKSRKASGPFCRKLNCSNPSAHCLGLEPK